jgi:hypothetical protein
VAVLVVVLELRVVPVVLAVAAIETLEVAQETHQV